MKAQVLNPRRGIQSLRFLTSQVLNPSPCPKYGHFAPSGKCRAVPYGSPGWTDKEFYSYTKILQPKFLRCHRELWTADPPKSASCWKAPQISHTVERRDETLVVAFGRNTHVAPDPDGVGHRVWTYIDCRHAASREIRHTGAPAMWCAIPRDVASVM